MYKIQKAYEITDMELPTCMYRVKPINCTTLVSGEQTVQNLVPAVNGNPTREQVKDTPTPPQALSKKQAKKNKRSPAAAQGQAQTPTTNSVTEKENKISDKIQTPSKEPNKEQSQETIIQELEARQHEIINKLLCLRDKLNTMNGQVGQEAPKTMKTVTTKSETLTPPVATARKSMNVVVNADPEKPPYSVLLLVKLLKENYGLGIIICSHIHSSCSETLPDQLKLFHQAHSGASATAEVITITFIWKKLADMEPQLIDDPSKYEPVSGEENIAKFLSQALPVPSM